MKKTLLAAVLALFAPAALAQTYGATLSGAAEIPGPGDPDGSGIATVSISGTSVSYTLLTNNITAATMSHIHRGAAGVSGPVVVDFSPTFTAGSASGTVTATQAILDEIKANPAGFYVNVHTADFAAGAIRGQLSVPAVAEYLYPTAVKSAGVNGTFFVSDVSVLNPSDAGATTTFEFYAQSATGQTGPNALRTVLVPAGQQVVVKDVLGSLLGLAAPAVGALRVTSDRPVRLTHRVLNDQRSVNAGTSLLNVGAGSRADVLTEGYLGLLSNASDADRNAGLGYRTNVGWLNAGASPVTVTFTAKKNDGGVLGTSTLTIPGYGQGQQAVFSLIGGVAAADQAQNDFFVTYTTNGSGLLVFGTVVDNKTGDGLYLAGAPRP